jgi:hypothetical protein
MSSGLLPGEFGGARAPRTARRVQERGCRPCRGVEGRRANLGENKLGPGITREGSCVELRGSRWQFRWAQKGAKGALLHTQANLTDSHDSSSYCSLLLSESRGQYHSPIQASLDGTGDSEHSPVSVRADRRASRQFDIVEVVLAGVAGLGSDMTAGVQIERSKATTGCDERRGAQVYDGFQRRTMTTSSGDLVHEMLSGALPEGTPKMRYYQ